MAKDEYFVELRIEGIDLDPSAITNELGLQPSTVRRVGDTIGRQRFEVATWGYNGSESDVPPVWESLEEGLAFVLDRLSTVQAKIERYKGRFEIFWWCGHFYSGFNGWMTLSPSMLQRLGEFGVLLHVDTHFCRDADDVQS